MKKPIIKIGNRICMTTELFETICDTICERTTENAELRDELERTRDLLEFAECEADHYKDTARRMEKYENFYYAVKYDVDLTEDEFDEDEDEDYYVSNGIVWDGIHDNESC